MESREVFISYSRCDIDVVKDIKSVIEDNCGVKCWMDLNSIESGSSKFTQDIIDGIDDCNVFLFMLSEKSQESEYALLELNYAKDEGKHVVLVNVNKCKLIKTFKFLYGLTDRIAWTNQAQRDKLLRDIRRWVQPGEETKGEAVSEVPKVKETSLAKETFLKIKPDHDCVFYLDGEEQMSLKAGKIKKLPLAEGEYELKFVSAENYEDKMVEIFRMPAYDKLYLVELSSIRDKRLEKERMAEEACKKAYQEVDKAMACYGVFSDLKYFAQGYALVQKKETQCWHFLDKDGKLSKEGYQDARYFSSDGYAAVKNNGLWGVVDRNFKCRTGFVYGRLGDFSEGLAYFELEDPNGAIKIKRGFLNTSFNVELDLTKNYSGYGLRFDNHFICGLFKIWSYCHVEWIDRSGRIVAKIDELYRRFTNLSQIVVGDIINGAAKLVVYHFVSPNDCQKEDMQYIIPDQRLLHVNGDYSDDGYAYNHKVVGYGMAADYDGTQYSFHEYSDYGFVDKYGNDVSEYKYKQANTFSEHFAAVSMDGKKYGFINNQFKPICDFIYDDVGFFSEGKAAIKQDGQWGFINTEGKVVIPCDYEYVEHFSEGMAAVRKNRKWGFVNFSGVLVIPCIYDKVEHFSEGFCIVFFDKKQLFVDKAGEVLQLK